MPNQRINASIFCQSDRNPVEHLRDFSSSFEEEIRNLYYFLHVHGGDLGVVGRDLTLIQLIDRHGGLDLSPCHLPSLGGSLKGRELGG